MNIIGTLTQATMTRRTNFLWDANIHLFLLCPRSVYLFDTSEGQNNEVVAWNHGWLMSSEWQIGRVDIHTDLLLSSPPFTLLFHSLPLLLAIYLSDRNIVGPRREANGVPRYNSSTSGGGGEEVNWRRLSFFFRCMSHTWMKMPNLCHFISKYFSSIF